MLVSSFLPLNCLVKMQIRILVSHLRIIKTYPNLLAETLSKILFKVSDIIPNYVVVLFTNLVGTIIFTKLLFLLLM